MKKINYYLFLLLLTAFCLLFYKINKPFIGHHDWNGVFFGNVIRNTKKFGFLKTKFGAVYTLLPKDTSEFSFYTHYPPVFRTALGISAKIFGVYEWSMRLTAICCSIFALYFFFKTAEVLFNKKTAFLAGLFFIFNPMFLYFGKMPVHEVFGLALIIFSIYRYILFFKEQARKNFLYLVFSLILACQTVWSAYYLAPLFIIHYFLFNKNAKKKSGRKFYCLLLIPIFSFFSHLIYTFILTGRWDNDLFSTMFFRMKIGKKADKYPFTLLQYIKQESLWLTVYFTRLLSLLSLFYFFLLGIKIFKRKINFKDGLLLIILIFPFIDPIIFKNLCFIHDYKLYYFLLSLPLFGSLGLFYIKDKLNFIWQKKEIFSFLFIFFIFVFFAFEKIEFTKSLLNTSMNRKAYDLGLAIMEKTKESEAVLIGSKSFAEHFEPFVKFYSQRRVVYIEPNLKEFKKSMTDKTSLIVFIKEREKLGPDLMSYLKENYSFFEKEELLFFYLK